MAACIWKARCRGERSWKSYCRVPAIRWQRAQMAGWPMLRNPSPLDHSFATSEGPDNLVAERCEMKDNHSRLLVASLCILYAVLVNPCFAQTPAPSQPGGDAPAMNQLQS